MSPIVDRSVIIWFAETLESAQQDHILNHYTCDYIFFFYWYGILCYWDLFSPLGMVYFAFGRSPTHIPNRALPICAEHSQLPSPVFIYYSHNVSTNVKEKKTCLGHKNPIPL